MSKQEQEKYTDKSYPVREGEGLDLDKLGKYLSANLAGFSGALELEQFPGGYSNLTYLLRTSDGVHSFVLRRPPFGSKVASAHDMSREFRILSALNLVYNKVPEVLLFCDDQEVLGADFYLMERLEGVILRPKMKEEMIPDEKLMAGISKSFISAFAELHAVDVKAANLLDFGKPEGYIDRQVAGWSKRYLGSKTDEIPAMDKVAKWLAENKPASSGVSLIHNDFKYDTMVLDPSDWTNITGVLDWEMATLGDPLMDLGSSLGYWVHPGDPDMLKQFALSPSVLPGNPSREELLQQYASVTGREVGNGVFYYAYGLFKIAVIVQQIYYRYKKGLTSDKRFANLGFVVQGCATSASQAIDKGRLDRLY
ncbi:MAG: aminoglycoside phosphotransferase (APT) family kinase protein [Limisphaerales bacterium]|jgi:aminoglycoside phosphotransferase (APT) family kinase protein